jgi:hypothetical protein
MLDLLDHQPKDALEALRTTRISGLPDGINHQRMLLEARALAALKLWDQALDAIAVDEAADTKAMRADIYWESGNWDLAGQKTEELLPAVVANSAAPTNLSKDEQQLLMRATVAYSLASDQPALDRLRARFGLKALSGPDASAFAMMTGKVDTQNVAVRDAIASIASIDALEQFMKDFRKRHLN